MVGTNKKSITSSQPSRQARAIFHLPVIQAFLIQCLAFPASLVLVGVISVLVGGHGGIAEVTLLQGGIAAVITRWRGLAIWWVTIQLLFPGALIVLHSLALPPWIFLAAFFFLLSIYWTTFRTQVPFYPSNSNVWEAILTLLPHGHPVRLIDIGSGMGGGVLHMASRQPQSSFVGVEVAPLPWLISAVKGWVTRSKARFLRGDYADIHLGEYDVVFAYLSPAAMPALWQKAQSEMRRGSLLLSFEFPIPHVPASVVVQPEKDGASLYAWHI